MNKINRLAMIRNSFKRLNDVIGVLPISLVEIREEITKAHASRGLAFARANRRNDTEMENAEGIKSQLRFDSPSLPNERETEILLSAHERRQLVKETGRRIVSTVFVRQAEEAEEAEETATFAANPDAEYSPIISREFDAFAAQLIRFESDCEAIPLRLMA